MDKEFSEQADALLQSKYESGVISEETYINLVHAIDNNGINNLFDLEQEIRKFSAYNHVYESNSNLCPRCGDSDFIGHICNQTNKADKNLLGILSLLCGTASFLIFTFVLATLGVILSIIGLSKKNNRKFFNVLGLLISIISLAIFLMGIYFNALNLTNSQTSTISNSQQPSVSNMDVNKNVQQSMPKYEMFDSLVEKCWKNSSNTDVLPNACDGTEDWFITNRGACNSAYFTGDYAYSEITKAGSKYCIKARTPSKPNPYVEQNKITLGSVVDGYTIIEYGSCSSFTTKKDKYEYATIGSYCGEKYMGGEGFNGQYNYNLSPGESYQGYTLVALGSCQYAYKNMGTTVTYKDITIDGVAWCAYF